MEVKDKDNHQKYPNFPFNGEENIKVSFINLKLREQRKR